MPAEGCCKELGGIDGSAGRFARALLVRRATASLAESVIQIVFTRDHHVEVSARSPHARHPLVTSPSPVRVDNLWVVISPEKLSVKKLIAKMPPKRQVSYSLGVSFPLPATYTCACLSKQTFFVRLPVSP